MPMCGGRFGFTAQKSRETFSPPSIRRSRVTASQKPIQSSEVMPSKRMNAIFISLHFRNLALLYNEGARQKRD